MITSYNSSGFCDVKKRTVGSVLFTTEKERISGFLNILSLIKIAYDPNSFEEACDESWLRGDFYDEIAREIKLDLNSNINKAFYTIMTTKETIVI